MSIIQVLKKPEVRKLFGERELVIIRKQIMGVRLTQSEKNRLSRDIRKKFRAIKALSPFAREKQLRHGFLLKKKIQQAKKAVLNHKKAKLIKEIILFGSTAEKQRALISDIDIVVKFKRPIANPTRFRIEVLKSLSDDIDLNIYHALPKKIRKEIDNKGKILWKKE